MVGKAEGRRQKAEGKTKRQRAGFFWLCLLPSAFCLQGCQPAGVNTRNVVISGAEEMESLMTDMGKRFEGTHPGVRIDVQARGSARGISDVRQGLADLAMLARPLRPDESSLRAFPIAHDGLCLVVARDNPITSLSDQQVVRLWTRSATNWSQVGGKEAAVLLIGQAEGHSLSELFIDHFGLQGNKVRLDAVVNGSEAALKAVAANPNALSYASVGVTEFSELPVRALPYRGVAATLANVRDGSYPLSRPLQLVTRDEPQGLVKDFLDFARSDAVVDFIEKAHFVPVASGGR
jgi:phosphate transport system substrate-binding protein